MKIFISAVTSEFGKARDAVAADFRARGHQVAVQSDFQQSPDSETLLGTLAEYIRDCHAVICIVGKRSGASPPARAAERHKDVLPKDINEASYTQWEFFLARHYKRRPYIYIAKDDYKPDRDAPGDNSTLQEAYVAYLKTDGAYYTEFSTAEQIRIAALRDEPKIASDLAPVRPAATKPIVLPYPSLGPLFKGREGFMQQLHESLSRSGQIAITSKALYGLGGIGKTRAAVEYAWAHRDDYSALLFVVAETPEALRRNLAALAAKLVPDLDTTDDTVRLKAVLDWLAANPGWFLILDNLDTKEALAETDALLARLSGGHLVITSQLADFSANFEPIALDVLPLDDATAFLLDRTKGRRRNEPDDDSKAREIAVEIDGLALALEQVGAYIAKQRMTFGAYLERWRAAQRDDVSHRFDSNKTTDHRGSITVTWQTSVAHLTEPGRRLLERLAWLAPEKVPEFLLDVSVPGAESEDLHDALSDLTSYSLIARDPEGPFFQIHRLVQDASRRSLSNDRRTKALTEALGWVDAAFPSDVDDVRSWPRADPLIPHASAVTSEADNLGIADPTARLMGQLGLLLHSKKRNGEAEPLLQRALTLREKTLGPVDPFVASALNDLAGLYQSQGRFGEAESLYQRALTIRENALGASDPSISTTLNNLAVLYSAQGRYAEAEPLCRRALAISESVLGKDDPSVGTALSNLAALHNSQGRYSEAEPLYQRALAIRERAFGHNHPAVGMSLGDLALLYESQGRYAEAEPLYLRSLAIRQDAFGPNDPDVGTSFINLAGLYESQGRYAEAEPLYLRALTIREKTFGGDHPSVGASLNNLAGLYRAQGRYADAEPLYQRSLAIREKALGVDHPSVSTSLNNLGALYRAQSRLGEAEPLYQRALAIREKALGPDDPDVATSLNNLAGLYESLGRDSEAEPLYRRSLVILEQSLGPQNSYVQSLRRNIAAMLERTRKTIEPKRPADERKNKTPKRKRRLLFISYASENLDETFDIVRALERRNQMCWIAPRDVQPGKSFAGEIVDAIKSSAAVLLVFSNHCNNSAHILREVIIANGVPKIIIPCRIENAHPASSLEYYLAGLQWIDALDGVSPVQKILDALRTSDVDE